MVEQTIAEKITQRRWQILVHSCLYYRMDENIISDYQYDAFARELKELQEKYPEIAKTCAFHKEFEGFTGSGFDLPYNHPEIVWRAQRLLSYHERGK